MPDLRCDRRVDDIVDSGHQHVMVSPSYLFWQRHVRVTVILACRCVKQKNPKEYIQRRYACLVSQMSRGLVYSEESERSSETPPGHISDFSEDLRIYELVVCEERDKRCVCFKARQGVAEAQVQELVRRLRMSIRLEEKGSRSVGEVMNAVFWKRAETTPRHEEGIGEEEEV